MLHLKMVFLLPLTGHLLKDLRELWFYARFHNPRQRDDLRLPGVDALGMRFK